jgi:hypothetical protein
MFNEMFISLIIWSRCVNKNTFMAKLNAGHYLFRKCAGRVVNRIGVLRCVPLDKCAGRVVNRIGVLHCVALDKCAGRVVNRIGVLHCLPLDMLLDPKELNPQLSYFMFR